VLAEELLQRGARRSSAIFMDRHAALEWEITMTMSADQRPSRTAKPLLGKKILITRPRERASRFAALLREDGAEPVEVRRFRYVPPIPGSRSIAH